MNDIQELFERYNSNQSKLTSLLNSALPIFRELGIKSAEETISILKQRADSDRLKVLIVGEFKNGKSTLINALLGENLLPTYPVPCTAVINEIKYDKQKRAVVHFRKNISMPLPEKLAPEARQHIEAHLRNHGSIPPLEIAIDRLEHFVVIPNPAKDHAESVAESPFEKVEIFWPLELCKNGVEFIDSPGLNEHGTRTRVTLDYLESADVIVFVLSCLAFPGQSEVQFVESNLHGGGYDEILFACNRFDQITESNRKTIKDYGYERLSSLTKFGDEGVFFLSAFQAMEGRLRNNPALLESSGMMDFERHLTSFLVEGRGRLKLRQPAARLRLEVTRALNQSIPDQSKLFLQSVQEIERRLEIVRPKVDQTQARCSQIRDRLHLGRERLCADVREKTELFVRSLADKVPNWLEIYTPKAEIHVLSLRSAKSQAKPLVAELAAHISTQLESEFKQWNETELTPYINTRITDLMGEVRESVQIVLSTTQSIRNTLNGATEETEVGSEGWKRLFEGLGGLFLGGPCYAIVAANLGIGEMLKSLLPSFLLTLGAILLSVTNPIILMGILLSGGILQSLLASNKITLTLKKKVGEAVGINLREKAGLFAQESVATLNGKLNQMIAETDQTLQKELDQATHAANAVLTEKRAGEAATQQRLAQLDDFASKLKHIQSESTDLVDSLSR